MFADNSSGICAQLGTSADMGHMPTSCAFQNACDFFPLTSRYTLKKKN